MTMYEYRVKEVVRVIDGVVLLLLWRSLRKEVLGEVGMLSAGERREHQENPVEVHHARYLE